MGWELGEVGEELRKAGFRSISEFSRQYGVCRADVRASFKCGYSRWPRRTWGLSNAKAHPLYFTYRNMLARCYDPLAQYFHLYGGRNIRVCGRWYVSFWNFVEDMGPKPSADHSIDRIDNDGDYTPENCRWATWTEQANNRRPNQLNKTGGV
jgi:hypothetical protein